MRGYNASILVFILCIYHAIPAERNSWRGSLKVLDNSQEHDWDILIFTQQWPMTVCREWKDKNSSHSCALPDKNDMWTIHGIWPTKLHTKGPVFCNRTWHFDEKLIQPIENKLETYWKNIENETPTYGFWAHEWTKHGTCAAVLEPLNNEFKYFSKGLEWYIKINIANLLESHNVYPSNEKTYKVLELYQILNTALGTNPVIICHKEHGKNWLSEVRVCFDKNLQPTNCDGIVDVARKTNKKNIFAVEILTNCDTNEDVFFPRNLETVPQKTRHWYVQLYMLVSWLQWFTL